MAKPGILVGIGNINEIGPLVKAGATEFYTGLRVTKEVNFPNFRANDDICNLNNAHELKKTAKIAHKHKKKLFLAVNMPIYKPNTHANIAKTLVNLLETNIDGLTIADFYLMHELAQQLKKMKLKTKIHLSSLVGCFNKSDLDFFKQFNVSRILLPQHLYSHEASDFLREPNIETEIFYHLCMQCNYVSSRCHMGRQSLYEERKIIKSFPCFYKFSILNWQTVKNASEIYSRWGTILVNGFSNLYDSVKSGIDSIKLGSRGLGLDTKLEMVKGLVEVIKLINKAKDKKSFLTELDKVINIRKNDSHFRNGKQMGYY